MDSFFERLIIHAATIDELLSDDFASLTGQKSDADLAARRLAAWCQSCASGDWSLFERRLHRDGWSIGQVLTRFATVRRKASAALPVWVSDAIWIEEALGSASPNAKADVAHGHLEPCAFEDLFTSLVHEAETLLWSNIAARASERLNEPARACLRRSLLKRLSDLCTPAIYERFDKARRVNETPANTAAPAEGASKSTYTQFVADMKAGGFRRLFEDKPVLLRLIALTTGQWIDTSRELLLRLDADLPAIISDILQCNHDRRMATIEGDLSDPHDGGRSVQILSFEDGSRVVYKPKDLRVDVAWRGLIEQLNRADPPVELRAARAIARDGYGWTEFIDHTGCDDKAGCSLFFRRAGAWLALFHCFVATDMHQENIVAASDHPVPIDLEMILQATAEERKVRDPDGLAFAAGLEILANSVATVGLLPAYGRTAENSLFAFGGMAADWNSKSNLEWNHINSDLMRPSKSKPSRKNSPNLPHVDGHYSNFGDHIEDFVSGFEDYAKFLLRRSREANMGGLFDGFANLPVRKVVRRTQFYYMLLQRLKNPRTMDDGVIWSAQADFVARLADWEKEPDPFWAFQRAERSALLALNVPRVVSMSDGTEIRDATGLSIQTESMCGLDRARARVKNFDEQDIAWQVEVIRYNTSSISKLSGQRIISAEPQRALRSDVADAPTKEMCVAETNRIVDELSRQAIRRGSGAAWIGLDWLGESEFFQLICLGPELYNGVSGIALFLAAHSAVTGSPSSGALALAGVSHLRRNLKSRNAARVVRSVGIGGAAGLGSIVYALSVMSEWLHDEDLLADAHAAAGLFTDDLIKSDKQLDIIGGSAGAILGLLRLHRHTQSDEVLKSATKCGEYLIGQNRFGQQGRRSWVGQGFGPHPLNGMAHGAAGFAYALASLSVATGREEFAQAASECIAFENSSYDAKRHNWPDFRRGGEPSWPSQWCHGAPGIGLARIATARQGGLDADVLANDIRNAIDGAKGNWPNPVDTLCCGTLGSIELLREAGSFLGRSDLRELASKRLMTILQTAAATGDYRWHGGTGRVNLGLFRGLAGVGYTLLRCANGSLPNILIWE